MSEALLREPRPGEATIDGEGAGAVLRLRGDWTLAHHAALRRQAEALRGRLDAARGSSSPSSARSTPRGRACCTACSAVSASPPCWPTRAHSAASGVRC